MNEIEFEDSSITVMTQRTQGHLLTGKDQVRSKANSGYEVHRVHHMEYTFPRNRFAVPL